MAPAEGGDDAVYDVLIVGAGVSGLQCVRALLDNPQLSPALRLRVLEAGSYAGGRIRQSEGFIPGVKAELGAELLHGNATRLNRFAEDHGEPLEEVFVCAHGDGGPLDLPVAGGGYGLFYIGQDSEGAAPPRLLRFDAEDEDFVSLNQALWGLKDLDEQGVHVDASLSDHLDRLGTTPAMKVMAAAGFSNTLCTNSPQLSLRQTVRWLKLWEQEGEGGGGDFRFVNSYSCLVDHLRAGAHVSLNSPVTKISLPTDTPLVQVEVRQELAGAARQLLLSARSVVVTASPHVLRSGLLAFEPPLPGDKEAALRSSHMHAAVKVFLSFSARPWPQQLHGLIVADTSLPLPDIWFRDVPQAPAAEAQSGLAHAAHCYATGFATAEYADRLLAAPGNQDELLLRCVQQLDTMLAHLAPEHMSANSPELQDRASSQALLHSLPAPSAVYLGGMVQAWDAGSCPYIGGGYCSPMVGKGTEAGAVLARPMGSVFFAGEATSEGPGASVHAAMETGVRAAAQVAAYLQGLSQ